MGTGVRLLALKTSDILLKRNFPFMENVRMPTNLQDKRRNWKIFYRWFWESAF